MLVALLTHVSSTPRSVCVCVCVCEFVCVREFVCVHTCKHFIIRTVFLMLNRTPV